MAMSKELLVLGVDVRRVMTFRAHSGHTPPSRILTIFWKEHFSFLWGTIPPQLHPFGWDGADLLLYSLHARLLI